MFVRSKRMTVCIISAIAISTIGVFTDNVLSDENKTVMIPTALSDSSASSQPTSIRVLWKVTEYKPGPSSTMKKESADALLFSPLDIDESRITFAGKSCTDVVFQKERLPLGNYLKRVHAASPEAVGLSDQEVEVVKTNCTIPGFGEYFRLPDRRLVIVIDGTFFFLEPAVNY